MSTSEMQNPPSGDSAMLLKRGHAEQSSYCAAQPTPAGSAAGVRTDAFLPRGVPGVNALVASLRTCEIAAEATLAISEGFLTDACSEALTRMKSEPADIKSEPGPAVPQAPDGSAGPVSSVDKTPASPVGSGARKLASVDNEVMSDIGSSLEIRTESLVQRSKRTAREDMGAQLQEGSEPPSIQDLPGLSVDTKEKRCPGSTMAAPLSRPLKRRREAPANITTSSQSSLTSPSSQMSGEDELRCRAYPVMPSASGLVTSASRATENGLGSCLSLSRRRGPAVSKQSRMSRRLESFRRDAEEALRGQHNSTVMNIFSIIDGQTRRLRGGSMSASELDMRIMAVIDRCLPLEGSEAKAVEAVLNMAAVRELKGSLEGVARSEGTLLDLITLSKVCKHIPGVCFDKWNLGWIATWREDRRPVHKHFSAKKYGFFRAREFAICYRSRMTSDLPRKEATLARKSLFCWDDLTPLLESAANSRGCKTAPAPVAASASQVAPLNLMNASGAAKEQQISSVHSFTSADGSPGLLKQQASLPAAAAFPDARTVSSTPARGAKQGCPAAASLEACPGVHGDEFLSSDGWADLVSRTPKVERVSFDFTNQSWIAQWKQYGRTTYRRFAVSKYGFSTAHKLAVEYKAKFFKKAVQPVQPGASFVGSASTTSGGAAPVAEGGGATGVLQERLPSQRPPAPSTRESRPTRTRCPSRRQLEAMNDSACMQNSGKEGKWRQTQLMSGAEVRNQEHQGDKGCANSFSPATSSSKQEHLSQLVDQHQSLLFEIINSNLKRPTEAMQPLGEQPAPESGTHADGGKASSHEAPVGTGGLCTLETLLSSYIDMGEVPSCSMSSQSAIAGKGLEGTISTATPTNHTQASVDAFPVNTLGSPGPLIASSSETEAPEADDRQAQDEIQKELHQAALELIQLRGEMMQLEDANRGNEVAACGAPDSTARSQDVQQQTFMSDLEMLRTAIKCMILDLDAKCIQDTGPEAFQHAYSEVVTYHLKFVDEETQLAGLSPYCQLFAPCFVDNVLPSKFPRPVRKEFLHKLGLLSTQQQHDTLRHKHIIGLLLEQTQQQRQ
ncbi:hypothetical protein Efla_006274 [Eimeria flavescens]